MKDTLNNVHIYIFYFITLFIFKFPKKYASDYKPDLKTQFANLKEHE